MYVSRSRLEAELVEALASTQHIVIHGESGSGKSWLYKRVFAEQDVVVEVVNMANAVLFEDLAKAFRSHVDRNKKATKTGYRESKSVKLAGTGMDHTGSYEIGQPEPFEQCLSNLRSKASDKMCCLVFENFESILEEPKILKQVGACITLLDDDIYAAYRVKLVIVGTSGDIRDYFSRSKNLATVSNRLQEIAEVARLQRQEALELLVRGLVVELGCVLESQEATLNHALWATMRIPQQLQEYGLYLALESRATGGLIDDLVVEKADRRFVKDSLTASYSKVESAMNSRQTKAGRRDQTIYALGKFDGEDFDHNDIEPIVRREFPESTNGITLNIAQTLGELAKISSPLIRRSPKGDHYRFTNPKDRMCIRSMLKKHPDTNKVERMDLRVIK